MAQRVYNRVSYMERNKIIGALHALAERHGRDGAYDVAAAFRELAQFRELADRMSTTGDVEVIDLVREMLELGLGPTDAVDVREAR